MKENLKELQEFVTKMKSTSSLLEKKVIIGNIKDNEFITKALNYTYDPYKKYYVTSKTCMKNFNLRDSNYIHDTVFELLDDLNNGKVILLEI